MKKMNIKIGFFVVGALTLLALLAPWLAPHDPSQFYLDHQLVGPENHFWFGHDNFGRCLLSRVIYGARVSLGIGIVVVMLNLLVGLMVGLIAGWYGGWVDRGVSFLIDSLMAFPGFLLAISLAAFVGASLFNIILILSILGWCGYARLVRGQVLAVKEAEYVRASQALGASVPTLLLKHILPNLMGPLTVQATFGIAGVVLVESTLSFLGVGVPIEVPSWGNMLDIGTQYLLVAPHLSIFPGMFIMLVVLGFNFLGDGLRDRLDPRGRNDGC